MNTFRANVFHFGLQVSSQMVCSLSLQGFSSDALRFVVFFTCFSVQLIELVLSCFSDQKPLSEKNTVMEVTHTRPRNPPQHRGLSLTNDLIFVIRTNAQRKTPHFFPGSSSSGLAGINTKPTVTLFIIPFSFHAFILITFNCRCESAALT